MSEKFDMSKDSFRRSRAHELEKRINWDQVEGLAKGLDFQIFKSDYQNMHVTVKMHKHSICMAIIYGMESKNLVDVNNGVNYTAFSGFKQRYDRMPTQFDEIVLMAEKYYFSNIGQNVVYSNLNWKLK
jgi:hypothetical protein